VEGFWVGWSEEADVAAAYEVHISPSGVETSLHVTPDALPEDDVIARLDEALANLLVGHTASGDPPRRVRNLQEPIACVHAEVTRAGTVTVGWGSATREDRIGGRAEARVLLRHGRADLNRRRGLGRLARDPLAG
jgi:hypothetical protein